MEDWLKQLNDFATYSLKPDHTFFVDVSPEEGQKRRSGVDDRIESAGLALQQKVREQYLMLAKEYPKRIIILDGTASMEIIQSRIQEEIKRRFLF